MACCLNHLQIIEANANSEGIGHGNKSILPNSVSFTDARMLESLLEELEKSSTQQVRTKSNELMVSGAQIRLVLQETQLLSNEKYEKIESLDNRARLMINLLIPIDRYFQLIDEDESDDKQIWTIRQNYVDRVNLVYRTLKPIYMENNNIVDSHKQYQGDESIKLINLIDSFEDNNDAMPLSVELISLAYDAYKALLDKCNQLIMSDTLIESDELKQDLIGILNFVDARQIRVLAKRIFPRLNSINDNKISKNELLQLKHTYEKESSNKL